MKAAQRLAAAALLCAMPASIDALAKVETRTLDALEDDPSRGLMHVVSNLENICVLFVGVPIVGTLLFSQWQSWPHHGRCYKCYPR